MAAGGSQPSLRKYLGAIKDTTTVSIAKVNSDYKELDVAIVRATNHVERPSKEKHVKAIFYAISSSRPRADVAYCIHALSRRLAKTHNWAVALKTLIVIHRALREVDPTFREELINYGRHRSHMLNMSHFKDDSSAYAWDYSAWVRAYALFLEERLECYHVLKYDVESDPSRTRELGTVELLEQLPALQQLLFHLLNCQPQGAASHNFIIQLALSMIVVESIKVYNAISDGTTNLVDKFFEMERHDAMKALDIYRKAGQQAGRLSEFYEVCKSIDIRRGENFIKIEQPPASFLTAMEEYVRDAPRVSTIRKDQVKEEKEVPKVVLAIEYNKSPEVQDESPQPPPSQSPPPAPVKAEAPVSPEIDLLGLHETGPDTIELENQNALALAIVPVENPSTTVPTDNFGLESGTTGWELALVTAPSSNEAAASASKLAGGLDKLTLDSLYDDAIRQASQPTSYNPWETAAPMAGFPMQPVMAHDPFYASRAVAAPHSVQMAAMAQQQQAFMLQQQMMMGGAYQQYQQPQATLNPFGNSYAAQSIAHQYGSGMGMGMPQAPNTYRGLI